MNSYKRRNNSTLLGRMAHADIFEVDTASKFLFALFASLAADGGEIPAKQEPVVE